MATIHLQVSYHFFIIFWWSIFFLNSFSPQIKFVYSPIKCFGLIRYCDMILNRFVFKNSFNPLLKSNWSFLQAKINRTFAFFCQSDFTDLLSCFFLCVYSLMQIAEHIHREYGHLLTNLDMAWLDPVRFSAVIHDKGAPLDNCWGFIDGTARPISRPCRGQAVVFSGHKRTHCLKFQVRMLLSLSM